MVDDHPAVRTGLVGLLRSEPGLVVVGGAEDAASALEKAERSRPDVVLLDYDLPDYDGLLLCCDLKALSPPPGVIVYSAFARPRLAPAAAVAGADAMVDKGAPPGEMFEAVRMVARGTAELPGAPPDVIERCISRLEPADIPLFGMALNGTPPDEIATVTGEDLATTRAHLRELVGRLQGRGQPVSTG